MALAETAIVGLTFAVAKGLAKVALADQRLATEIAGGGLDVAKTMVEKLRHGDKQAADVAQRSERIARAVAALIDREGSGRAEGDREAGVLAGADAIARAEIDAALLVRLDLDPGQLAAYVLDRRVGPSRSGTGKG
jgi:hypothetical protein